MRYLLDNRRESKIMTDAILHFLSDLIFSILGVRLEESKNRFLKILVTFTSAVFLLIIISIVGMAFYNNLKS